MNFFFDTEFSEGWAMRGHGAVPTIELISIGIVCDDGREFYAESSEFSPERCNQWVIDNVIPHLGPTEKRITRDQIRDAVKEFLGKNPVLWAYYGSYDWVVFCWLFGTMIDLPEGFPMFPMDLQQKWVELGRPENVKPPKPKHQHNALADAKWNQEFHGNLKSHIVKSMDEVNEIINDQLKKYLETKGR